MNTRLEYLYRDGSNYKRFGSVVFGGVASEAAKARLMNALESTEFFIADQVRLPELFFVESIDPDDHCFHEIAAIVEVEEAAHDPHGRTFDEFVMEVERAGRAGWKAFDPAARDVARRRFRISRVTP